MNKDYIIIILLIVLFLFFLGGCVKYEGIRNKTVPDIKYQIFSPGLDNDELIDYYYIFSTDTYPKTIKLENDFFTIEKVEIEKTMTDGFSAYFTLSFDGEQQRIGFWHPNGNVYHKDNGCLDESGKYYVCGGILVINIKEWAEQPNEEEKIRGVTSIYYVKRVFVQEIDYDINSNNWNYAKISLGLYREERVPPSIG